MAKAIAIPCALLIASSAAAGTVYFDSLLPGAFHFGRELFEVSISQSDLPSFDSLTLVFTYDAALGAEFTYSAEFVSSTTLPPADPIHFCGNQYCHVLIGGNRFVSPFWDAPLVIGELDLDTDGLYAGVYEVVVSASLETKLVGTPLSVLAYGLNQEPLEGRVAFAPNIPEPGAFILLALGVVAVVAPGRDRGNCT